MSPNPFRQSLPIHKWLPVALATLCPVWLLAVGMGGWELLRFEHSAGPRPEDSPRWPAATSVLPTPHRWNLVVALHPQCPCSVATLNEVRTLADAAGDWVQVHVIVALPVAEKEAIVWMQSKLVALADTIPNGRLVTDIGGIALADFGLKTSGEIALYRPGGEPVFRGGITPARGHRGPNPGLAALRRALLDSICTADAIRHWPVFGCALENS